eukprot:scaffold14313_cov36-Prasinocladus_malaysianus.AAC.2
MIIRRPPWCTRGGEATFVTYYMVLLYMVNALGTHGIMGRPVPVDSLAPINKDKATVRVKDFKAMEALAAGP